MKLKCKISSIEFSIAEFPLSRFNKISGIHPVFNLEQKELLKIYQGQFMRNKLSHNELRLLSIALLISLFNSIEDKKVIIDNPISNSFPINRAVKAIPMTIELIEIVNSKAIPSHRISKFFPKIVFSLDANSINFGQIPAILESILEEINNYYSSLAIRTSIDTEEEKLKDSLAQYNNQVEYFRIPKFLIQLSEYIISSLDYSNESNKHHFDANSNKLIPIKEFHKYIIQVSGNCSISDYKYKIKSDDIENLIDLISSQSSFDNMFIFQTIEQLKSMLKKGLFNRYGQNILANTNKINNSSELLTWLKDNPEPLKADYHDYNSYFIAKNNWIIKRNNFKNSTSS